jgi:hypothetical protein
VVLRSSHRCGGCGARLNTGAIAIRYNKRLVCRRCVNIMNLVARARSEQNAMAATRALVEGNSE